jgi:hypothetical protein
LEPGDVPVTKVLSGTWGTARAAQQRSTSQGAPLFGMWGIARAAQQGSASQGALLSGTWGTARAAQRGSVSRGALLPGTRPLLEPCMSLGAIV